MKLSSLEFTIRMHNHFGHLKNITTHKKAYEYIT